MQILSFTKIFYHELQEKTITRRLNLNFIYFFNKNFSLINLKQFCYCAYEVLQKKTDESKS